MAKYSVKLCHIIITTVRVFISSSSARNDTDIIIIIIIITTTTSYNNRTVSIERKSLNKGRKVNQELKRSVFQIY